MIKKLFVNCRIATMLLIYDVFCTRIHVCTRIAKKIEDTTKSINHQIESTSGRFFLRTDGGPAFLGVKLK